MNEKFEQILSQKMNDREKRASFNMPVQKFNLISALAKLLDTSFTMEDLVEKTKLSKEKIREYLREFSMLTEDGLEFDPEKIEWVIMLANYLKAISEFDETKESINFDILEIMAIFRNQKNSARILLLMLYFIETRGFVKNYSPKVRREILQFLKFAKFQEIHEFLDFYIENLYQFYPILVENRINISNPQKNDQQAFSGGQKIESDDTCNNELEKLKRKNQELQQECEQYIEQYQILKRQYDEISKYGTDQSAIIDFLKKMNNPAHPILDDLIYYIQLLKENTQKASHSLLYSEFSSFLNTILKFLKNEGIEPIGSVGDIIRLNKKTIDQFNYIGSSSQSDLTEKNCKIKQIGWSYKSKIFIRPTIIEIQEEGKNNERV